MRDPVRSGIARVARCMPQAFTAADDSGEFEVTVAGPPRTIAELGAGRWRRPPRVVPWDAGRLSAASALSWPGVNRAVGDATWYFPHWDVPWLAHPRRSIVLISDVIPLVVPGATSNMRRLVARQWIRRTAVKASRVAISTEFARSELIDIWPDLAGKIRVVPLGVGPQFFGTPSPLPEPLDAVAQRAAALGVTNRIHVLGGQPDSVVHGLYAGAACLFFPSRNEGFGLPILEALAAGTRVVIGRAGASMEVLGGHGTACGLDD